MFPKPKYGKTKLSYSIPAETWRDIIYNLKRHQQVRLLTVNQWWTECILSDFRPRSLCYYGQNKHLVVEKNGFSAEQDALIHIIDFDIDKDNLICKYSEASYLKKDQSPSQSKKSKYDVSTNSRGQTVCIELRNIIPFTTCFEIISIAENIQRININMTIFTRSEIEMILNIFQTTSLKSFAAKFDILDDNIISSISKIRSLNQVALDFNLKWNDAKFDHRIKHIVSLSLIDLKVSKIPITLYLDELYKLENLTVGLNDVLGYKTKQGMRALSKIRNLCFTKLNHTVAANINATFPQLHKLTIVMDYISPKTINLLLENSKYIKQLVIKGNNKKRADIVLPQENFQVTHLEINDGLGSVSDLMNWTCQFFPKLFSLEVDGRIELKDFNIQENFVLWNLVYLTFQKKQDLENLKNIIALCPNIDSVGLNIKDYQEKSTILSNSFTDVYFYSCEKL